MKWPSTLIFSAVLLAGCQSTPQSIDPFLGNARVTPPSTGQFVQPGTAQPYYQGPKAMRPAPTMPVSSPGTPSGIPPVGALSVPESRSVAILETPGEREYRTGRQVAAESNGTLRVVNGVVYLEAVPRETVANRSSEIRLASAEASVKIFDDDQPTRFVTPVIRPVAPQAPQVAQIQTIRPDPRRRVRTMPAPRRFVPAPSAIEISQLPPATTPQPPVSSGTPIFRTTSASTPVPHTRRSRTTEVVKRPAKYGHASDYSWLKGKLEYLQSKGEWKLRYIPIDGKTDEYGGSVVLTDPSVLAKMQPGDLIAVQGSLSSDAGTPGAFAPSYHVSRLKSMNL